MAYTVCIAGHSLGILILRYGNELLIKTGLGLLIIGYSVYSLVGKTSQTFKEDHKPWLFICGFLSGVLGGAYGLNGPPLVVYGRLRQWSAQHFRATLQAYFLPASLVGVAGYYVKGLITNDVGKYFLVSLATAVPAVFLGRYLNHRLKEGAFFRYIYCGLILVGVVLILTATTSRRLL